MSHLYRNYRAAVGVSSARLLAEQPPFIKRGRPTGKFAVGVRYEREVQEYLSLLALGRVEIRYLPSPWIEFVDRSGRRWCQPDALLLHDAERQCIIVEAKYQHCQEAWFQLVELYRPVVHALLPGYGIGLVEVVHWHDPSVGFPQRYDFTESPLIVKHANLVSVHIYNAKRDRALAAGCGSGKGDGEETGKRGAAERTARLFASARFCGGKVVG